jgi:hypothetical protein
MRGGRAAEIVAALILVLGTWLGFATAGLPRLAGAGDEPPNPSAFQLQNAMAHLRIIAETPHPVGSTAHDRVRDYLVDQLRKLGLSDVHVQSATGFNTLDGPIAATVANVVGRTRGTGTGPAILLMAHYDAVPRSFGAGDDGAGVAAILETLRAALAATPSLDRDLIVVFSDAEEDGLLGAEAFVDLHPWAKDVGVVLNFDARGDTGPVYMFQTTPGNSPLIRALARGVADARANSLTGEVYRHLPSDTDLSIWLHSGFAVGAFNFANVGGYTHYHTPIDNLASFDPRVLQQMGDYALGLTVGLGHTPLTGLRTTDAIYFNAPIVGVIRYPASWALMLGIDSIAIVVVLLGLGLYRRTLRGGGIGRGALALLLSLAIPTIVTLAGWRIISLLHPDYREILQRDPYNSLWYLLAFSAFTVAVVVEVQRRFATRATPPEMAIAPALVWGALGLVVAVTLPGASYLFAWPLFAAAASAGWWRRSERDGRVPASVMALLAVPVLVLWGPLIQSLEVALTARMLPFLMLLLALVLSLLSMPLQLVGRTRSWIVAAGLLISAGALVRAEVTAGFNDTRKRPDSLARIVDADSGRAWWASFDNRVDSWTANALGADPVLRPFTEYGVGRGLMLATAVAGPVNVPPSPVQVLENLAVDGGRRIHLRVAQSGVGEFAALYSDSGATVTGMTINGRVLPDGTGDKYRAQYHMGAAGVILQYNGVPEEGVDLRFTITTDKAVAIRVVTGVEGLPGTTTGPLPPRPVEMMAKPFVPTDMTITGWTIRP